VLATAPLFLNRWRDDQYREVFEKAFTIRERRVTSQYGDAYLTPEVLSRLSPCNQGKPWWEKRGLVTDMAYWIFVPIFTRYLRIWVTVCLTILIFRINDGQKIAVLHRLSFFEIHLHQFTVELMSFDRLSALSRFGEEHPGEGRAWARGVGRPCIAWFISSAWAASCIICGW